MICAIFSLAGEGKMKKEILFLVLALGLLSGCKAEKQEEPVSCVAAEDCVLCAKTGAEPWGQNNVGLVSLNTFDMAPLELNRYDSEGELIEKNTGTFTMRTVRGQEEGFCASIMEYSDRGHATLNVTLGEDRVMDREKAAAFLCENCLEAVAPEGEEPLGLGVVDFATGKVKALDRRITGFGAGDFYIHCDWREKGEGVELLVFYCPLRYGEEE